MCSLFQLPSKSVPIDTPALNSTLCDLQTLQGHQNKAISWVPSLSSQSKLFCLILRQLIDEAMGSEVFTSLLPQPGTLLKAANSGQVGKVHPLKISDLHIFSKHALLISLQLVGGERMEKKTGTKEAKITYTLSHLV